MQRRASIWYGAVKACVGQTSRQRRQLPAMILFARVRLDVERREDGADEQPRAEFARDEIGVLALPAEARLLRQRLLHHRRSIDEELHFGAEARAR